MDSTAAETREMTLMLVHGDEYQKEFHSWLSDNWHVWLRFVEESHRARRAGWQRYSARTVIEVLRHESNLREVGSRWKLNNNFIPDLSRLFLDTNLWAKDFQFYELRGSTKRRK